MPCSDLTRAASVLPSSSVVALLLTQSISRGPVSCACSQPWPVSAVSRQFDSQGPRLLPSRQVSQCRSWAIRLTVEDAIRLRICQYHGFGCARSATMTSGTLMIVSLEPMRMVTKLHSKSLRALEKSGRHNVPGRNQDRKSLESLTVPVCVSYVNKTRHQKTQLADISYRSAGTTERAFSV